MTRDTKMLLTIVAGATLAGWVLVRLLSPAPETTAPPVVVAAVPSPEQAPAPTAEPAVSASPVSAASAQIDADEAEMIVDELAVLVRAVRKDKHVHNVAFPESTRILDLPGVVDYVRVVEFWQPAFAAKKEATK